MDYLVAILHDRPLTIHFSLYNPDDSAGPVYVPRLLRPLGAFVQIRIFDVDNQVVYASSAPKAAAKLDPARDDSYQALEPGYTCGAMLTVPDLALPPGEYRLHLAYSNGTFRGGPARPVGDLAYETTRPFYMG